jgi:hypothetical protein
MADGHVGADRLCRLVRSGQAGGRGRDDVGRARKPPAVEWYPFYPPPIALNSVSAPRPEQPESSLSPKYQEL